jgi:hypothetical protein
MRDGGLLTPLSIQLLAACILVFRHELGGDLIHDRMVLCRVGVIAVGANHRARGTVPVI